MATFLAAFKSIPPVIRRRAKELLDIIQETLKEYHDSVKIAEAAELDTIVPSESAQDTPRVDAEVMASTSTDMLNSRLWSKGSSFLRPLKIKL
jgi:exosome complex exonuclease RRP6